MDSFPAADDIAFPILLRWMATSIPLKYIRQKWGKTGQSGTLTRKPLRQTDHRPTAGSEKRSIHVDIPFSISQNIIDGLAAQNFRVARVFAMQCYSFANQYEQEWNKIAIQAHGFVGQNILGLGGGWAQ